MQYSGKYYRRNCDRASVPRMPYMNTENCDTCNSMRNARTMEPMHEPCENYRNEQPSCPKYRENFCDQDFSLAMAYIYPQEFDDLNEPDTALCQGTLFRALDMPFYGCKKRC